MTNVFPLLSGDDREALTRLGRARRIPRGGWLMAQGEAGDSVAVVLHGRAKISTVTPEGVDVVCAVHGPGSVIGHYEAIDSDGQGRTASVIALEAVDCRMIDGDDFRAFLRVRPPAAMALMRALVRELRAADRRRADVAAGDVTRRLARFLFEQLEIRHQLGEANGDLDFGLSQAELAGVVSASRAAVVRALSALRNTGAVATARRQITVVDVAVLREAAL